MRYRLLWGRFGDEIRSKKRWKRTGYFGHTPVQTYPADFRPGGGSSRSAAPTWCC